MTNSILIINKDKEECVTDDINGINVSFTGEGNCLKVHEPFGKFKNIRIQFKGNNGLVEIGPSKYIIQNFSIETLDANSSVQIDGNFSCRGAELLVGHGTKISIGDDCMFSSKIFMRTTDSHVIFDLSTGDILNFSKDIHIGNHVWIGNSAFILKGSQIGDNSVVAASTVVNKIFKQQHIIIAGNPGKAVKNNISWSRKNQSNYVNEKKANHVEPFRHDKMNLKSIFQKLLRVIGKAGNNNT